MKPLPIWDLVVASYSRVIEAFGYALRISGPWILLLVLLTILTVLLTGGPVVQGGGDQGAQIRSDIAIGLTLFLLLQFVVYVFALASIAVLWHRKILLDETSDASFPFRLDRPVWRYIGYFILISLVLLVPAMIATGVAAATGLLGGSLIYLAGVIGAIALVFLLIASLRLSIVLPAVSVGREGFGIAHAWEVTRGNGLRLLAASILIGLGMVVISLLAGIVTALLGALVGAFAEVITVLVNVFGTLVSVSSLSLAYGFLVEDRPIER